MTAARTRRKEKEGKERVCSPKGFKAAAGLRGSYGTSVRHTNSTWPLSEHPSPHHLLPSFSFFFHLSSSKFFPPCFSSNNYMDTFAYLVLPFRVPRAFLFVPRLRSSHSSRSLRNLLLSFRVYHFSLAILVIAARSFSCHVYATYRHKLMLGQYFKLAAVISWTRTPYVYVRVSTRARSLASLNGKHCVVRLLSSRKVRSNFITHRGTISIMKYFGEHFGPRVNSIRL